MSRIICYLDPFAKVSVVSSYPSRFHPFLRLLGLTSLTHAKASSHWAAELAQSPHNTRSSHSDILALRLSAHRSFRLKRVSRETSAYCALEGLRRVFRYFVLQKGLCVRSVIEATHSRVSQVVLLQQFHDSAISFSLNVMSCPFGQHIP